MFFEDSENCARDHEEEHGQKKDKYLSIWQREY